MSVDKWQNDIAMILFLMQMFVSLFKCLFFLRDEISAYEGKWKIRFPLNKKKIIFAYPYRDERMSSM